MARWPARRIAGLGFIGIELVADLALPLRGRPSFYNGRGLGSLKFVAGGPGFFGIVFYHSTIRSGQGASLLPNP
jgi:hypothetical protein